jgi:probable rRNA maturation factor
MINIYVNEKYSDVGNTSEIEMAAEIVLRQYASRPDNELTVVIEDSEKLHELNNQFLGIDAPTDVLSFPSGNEETDIETGRYYLGDIIISYPIAVEQARNNGHPVMAELMMLVVHGTLHLLGYDHAEEAGKNEMWLAQREALERLGVRLNKYPD